MYTFVIRNGFCRLWLVNESVEKSVSLHWPLLYTEPVHVGDWRDVCRSGEINTISGKKMGFDVVDFFPSRNDIITTPRTSRRYSQEDWRFILGLGLGGTCIRISDILNWKLIRYMHRFLTLNRVFPLFLSESVLNNIISRPLLSF